MSRCKSWKQLGSLVIERLAEGALESVHLPVARGPACLSTSSRAPVYTQLRSAASEISDQVYIGRIIKQHTVAG
jgi:hypothetical protein